MDVCTLQTTTLETDHPFSESFSRAECRPSVYNTPRASHGRIRQPTRPVLGGASLTLALAGSLGSWSDAHDCVERWAS